MATSKANVIAGLFGAFARETLAVTSTSVNSTLTSGTYEPSTGDPAMRAILTVETASIRYTYDGTSASATVGHAAIATDILTLIGLQNIKNFKAVKSTTANSSIQVTYER